MPAAQTTNTNLRNYFLQGYLMRGLAVMTELWSLKTKNWVTGISVNDIDNDGDKEVIASTRDGRVFALTRSGDVGWQRIVGHKYWVGTVATLPQNEMSSREGKDSAARIFAGTRDGLVYGYDKEGKTVGRNGELYGFAIESGKAEDEKPEADAHKFRCEYSARQVLVNPAFPNAVLVGSEDRKVYLFDAASGEQCWEYKTGDWIRALCIYDINGDGEFEILVGSKDKHLYVLDGAGRCMAKQRLGSSIYSLCAADIDDDGRVEILVGTDNKELLALNPDLHAESFPVLWRRSFENRLLALQAVSIEEGCRVVAGSEDKHIYFLDGQGHTLWRHYLNGRVSAIYAEDIDRDGQVEVLAGSEGRLHCFRVKLVKDLSGKIQRSYQLLGKPAPAALTFLSSDERLLLQDIVREDVKEHLTLKQVKLEHVKALMDDQEYLPALSDLLRLQHQRVQVLWRKNDTGHIRSLSFGDISGDPRREVIWGTDEGRLYAATSKGRPLWNLPMSEEILAVQTGYVNRGRWEDAIVCSSDHYLYIVNGAKGAKGRLKTDPERRPYFIDEWMTCLHVSVDDRQGPGEIIIGSANKQIKIYDRSNLEEPVTVIDTPEGVETLYVHPHREGDVPEIVMGGISDTVYGYTRDRKEPWEYKTRDRVRALCVKDIDGDDQVEIVIGSEDRNVHVLDSNGRLKWRYFLPNGVLGIEAFDADRDGKIELFLACADGYLYVLNCGGEFLWKYRTTDRVQAVKVEDIDDDGKVEIALGAGDQLEVLQVVDQQEVQQWIDRCWLALSREQLPQELVDTLLTRGDPFLRAFALRKLAELHDPQAFDLYDRYAKDSAIEVRKELIPIVISAYPGNPQAARSLLSQFVTDPHEEMRHVFLEQIQCLIANDWEAGFDYLEGLVQNSDRFVRRAVVRQLHRLIDRSDRRYDKKIMPLLLAIIKDRGSEWVRQEAARTLAHFLDVHPGNLLLNLFRIASQGVKPELLPHIVTNARTPEVRGLFAAFVLLIDGLDDANALERIELAVDALRDLISVNYGRDAWLVYDELRHLFSIRTLSEIADYSCKLDQSNLKPENTHASLILRICQRLDTITRLLRIYLKREGLNDRLSSLLEANSTIDALRKFVEREYATDFQDTPAAQLPDRRIFELLLARWSAIVSARLNELHGRAELQVELMTRCVPREEQVSIWLSVNNVGSSSANNIKISLLHSDDFKIVGKNSFETEIIFAQENEHIEFSIRPLKHTSTLGMNFEIIYDDAETVMKTILQSDQLEFQSAQHEFTYISNPYSTGTPTHDSKMFFGRQKDIAFLKDNLTRAEAQTVMVLYGQRRTGKTSLLLHLESSTVLDPHIPVLLDMQSVSYQINANKFFYSLARYIYKEVRRRDIVIAKPQPDDFASDPTFAFNDFLDDVEEHLAGRRIIILIDEFEVLETQVKKGTLAPELFEYLRSLMQKHRYINFLLSGTHTIKQLTGKYWSVFFNIALYHSLSRLSPESAVGLITEPVAGSLEYEPHAIQKIRDLTADQPYLIHLICRSLVAFCNDERKSYVTINNVNTVLREVMQTGSSHFDWLWEQLSSLGRVVLSLLAEGGREEGRPLVLREIEEICRHYRIPFKRDHIVAALHELTDADAVEKIAEDFREQTVTRYKISVGLLRQWLLQEKPLEQVLEEEPL